MSDCVMDYPETFGEFVRRYQFIDSEEVYTNGILLVPVFRVDQAIKHYYDPLEQRCQQLEQVAKDLYNAAWCAWFLKTNNEMPDMDKDMKERVADSYLQNERGQLIDCGVSLND